MKTRCKLEHSHQDTQGLSPIPIPWWGQVQGAAPRCGRGQGAGGEPHPSCWPCVQAASYLCCYHVTSSSPSSAGSINGHGCFPQGMSTVGKLRKGGSGLYSSPVLGVLEPNRARRVPAASGAAANPDSGCGVLPGEAAPNPTPIPRHWLGRGRCRSLLCGTHSPEEPSQMSRPPCTPASPAEPPRHRGCSETMTVTLQRVPTEGPSHPQSPLRQQTRCVTQRTPGPVRSGPCGAKQAAKHKQDTWISRVCWQQPREGETTSRRISRTCTQDHSHRTLLPATERCHDPTPSSSRLSG